VDVKRRRWDSLLAECRRWCLGVLFLSMDITRNATGDQWNTYLPSLLRGSGGMWNMQERIRHMGDSQSQSGYGKCLTAKARLWLWLSGKSLKNGKASRVDQEGHRVNPKKTIDPSNRVDRKSGVSNSLESVEIFRVRSKKVRRVTAAGVWGGSGTDAGSHL